MSTNKTNTSQFIPLTEKTFNSVNAVNDKQPWVKNKQSNLWSLIGECKTEQEFSLIMQLLLKFENISEEREGEAFQKIAGKINNCWNLNPQNTLIVSLHDKNNPDSATALLYSIKNYFDKSWQNSLIVHKKPALEEIEKNGKILNIVFIDDFIGTGNQFLEECKYFIDELKKLTRQCTIYLTALCIMNQAKPNINCIKGNTIQHYAYIDLPKGISDDSNLLLYKDVMVNFEKRLFTTKFLKNYSLGYGKSEALFRYGNKNASNNNFPIFWSNGNKDNLRQSLLKRV